MWTVLFVIVNQIAYTVVVRLASSGTAARPAPASDATGYTVYSYAFLIVMVPHSVITVSLATAILPRLSGHAADADLPALARTLGDRRCARALAVVLPFALLLPVISRRPRPRDLGLGRRRRTATPLFAPTLALFGIGLVFFTVHYLTLRGFYALERTRTVFWIQCVVAVVNIAGRGRCWSARPTPRTPRRRWCSPTPRRTSWGRPCPTSVLRRLLGGLGTRRLLRVPRPARWSPPRLHRRGVRRVACCSTPSAATRTSPSRRCAPSR